MELDLPIPLRLDPGLNRLTPETVRTPVRDIYEQLQVRTRTEAINKVWASVYNIPASVRSLAKNVQGVGTLGNNSINGKAKYAPPHSQGPGDRTYVLTVYALSTPLQRTLPSSAVTRDVLLAAMKGKILASSELQVVYARSGAVGQTGEAGASRVGSGAVGGSRPADPLVQALDLNNDAIIDADEIARASESLKKLDKNADGKLTPDEFRPPRPQRSAAGNRQGRP